MNDRIHPLFLVFLCVHYLRIICIILHFALPLQREKGVKSFARKKVLDTL